MDFPGELEDIEILSQRLDFLTFLAEGAAGKPTIVEELDHSRSTVDRAISTLEDADFVEETDDRYVTTLTGRLAVERYEQFLDETETVLEAESFLEAVPPEVDLPASVVLDGDLETGIDDSRVVARVQDALSTAETCRAALPESVDADVLEAIQGAAREGQLTATILTDRSIDDRVSEAAETAPAEGVETLRTSVPAVGIVLLTGSEDERTLIAIASDDGAGGVVETTAPEAIEWAAASLDGLEEDAAAGDPGANADSASGRSEQ